MSKPAAILTQFLSPVISISVAVLLAFAVPASSDGSRTVAEPSQQEPVWVETVGTAHGNHTDPPCEVMEQARRDAEKKAIEQAVGTFVKADTLVINSMLDHKAVISKVKGRLEKVELLEQVRDRDDPDMFRVRLRALVRPVPLTEEEGIQIRLALNSSAFNNGDTLRINYQTNAAAYVYIYSVAADNSVTMLFPNSRYPDNFIDAGKEQVFPPLGSSVPCRVYALPDQGEKVSNEKILVVATRRREAILQGFQEASQLHTAQSTGTFGELYRKLSRLEPAEYGEAMEVYSIRGKGAKQ